jgi:hypothetical protein
MKKTLGGHSILTVSLVAPSRLLRRETAFMGARDALAWKIEANKTKL